MDPKSTQRWRRTAVVAAVGWALLAFVAALIAKAEVELRPRPPVVPVALAGDYWIVQWRNRAAEEAGVAVGDRVLAVDGRLADRRLHRRLGELHDGVANLYRIGKRDGRVLEVALLPLHPGERRPVYGLIVDVGLPLVGFVYFAMGVVVWLLRPDRAASWAFLLFGSTMAAGLFGAGWMRAPQWDFLWLNIPLIGATTFHLFTTYPIEPSWVVRRPGLRAAAYPVALLLGALAVAEGFTDVPPGGWRTAAFFFPIAIGFFILGMLVVERRRMPEGDGRDRADVVLLGALLSFLPLLLVAVAQFFLRTAMPWFLAFLWFFIFPLAVGYGIVRKQLFDIRGVARSSVAYGFTTLAVTGLFALLITSADAAFARVNINARSPWFSVVFLFFAILALNPLRDRIQGFVDAWFDRDRRSYRRAVREISEAMVSMLSIKEIVDRILVALTDTMGLERAMVLILDDDQRALRPAASRGDWGEEGLGFELPADHAVARQLWMRRWILARESFDDERDVEIRETCRDVFDTLEVELLVPILFGVDLLGVIAVGRKLSGERLDASDRSLLRTLANQSAIAIENAKAYDEIAQLNETLEARVDERTRELRDAQEQLLQAEKMKSLGQLVAGVAHELNNPISFVHANIQLIDEYVAKIADREASPKEVARARGALAKLIARSREGTERVKQIVQDLRTFSRMDQADLREVDLHEALDRTMGLMESRCKDCVAIERDYGEIPLVRCLPGQVNQVFLNLLMNACDAIDGTGTIRVVTRPIAGGVRLEFHDTGRGIPPEVHNRIFDPFFTTKPVGEGTGLGLSLSHSIVERHGGRMSVASEPGKGTTFIIELPVDAAAADA
jgi:signal transduction histidine kinase